jgi:hypothetical protein
MPDESYNPSPIGNPSTLARRNWWQTMLVKFIGKHTPKCREMVRIRLHERPGSSRIQRQILNPGRPDLLEATRSPGDFHNQGPGSRLPVRSLTLQLSNLVYPHLWNCSTRHRTKMFLREPWRHNGVGPVRERFVTMIPAALFPSI